MTQEKFDTAEFLLNNKNEIFQTLQPELDSVLNTKAWFSFHGLLISFEDAFADFIEYKLRWEMVNHTGKSFEDISLIVDKSFLVDLFGEDVLKSEYWQDK